MSDDSASDVDTAIDTGADAAPECSPDLAGIDAVGDLVPGGRVALFLRAEGDPGPVTWLLQAEEGGDAGSVGEDGTWTVGAALAPHQAEEVTVTASACGTSVQTTVLVDWPEASRVVVLYNPATVGSEDVARYYADFRGVPDANLCAVTTTTGDTLDGGDYPAFVEAVDACAADHVLYVVPTWGVPYKVSGRVRDLAGSSIVTVSLDALLFGGPGSVEIRAPDYNPYYRDGNSVTGSYKSVRDAGQLRGRGAYWLVTRIDGASAADAMTLVDRTALADAAATAGLLDGIVYVDGNRGDVEPDADAGFGSYEWGEWNMWGTRRVFEDLALYPVTWDGNGEEFGTPPAPTECPDALYYAGWYSYYHYNDCFTWTVGAIGGHLDSCSACDIRQAGTWSGSALLDGITATFGAVGEPYVAGMPEYDQFFYYLLQGANYAEAAYESTVVGYWMMTWVGDPLYRPYGVAPPIER